MSANSDKMEEIGKEIKAFMDNKNKSLDIEKRDSIFDLPPLIFILILFPPYPHFVESNRGTPL